MSLKQPREKLTKRDIFYLSCGFFFGSIVMCIGLDALVHNFPNIGQAIPWLNLNSDPIGLHIGQWYVVLNGCTDNLARKIAGSGQHVFDITGVLQTYSCSE